MIKETEDVEITPKMVDAEIKNAATISKAIHVLSGKDFVRSHVILAIVMASAQHSNHNEIEQLAKTATLIFDHSMAIDGTIQ